jgi:hypothetical protein
MVLPTVWAVVVVVLEVPVPQWPILQLQEVELVDQDQPVRSLDLL